MAQAQEEARAESERCYQAINEVRNDAGQNLTRMVATERAAADERVRDAVADYARRHRAPTSYPDVAQSGSTVADLIGLLAELLGEADRARVAVAVCEPGV